MVDRTIERTSEALHAWMKDKGYESLTAMLADAEVGAAMARVDLRLGMGIRNVGPSDVNVKFWVDETPVEGTGPTIPEAVKDALDE